MHKQKEIIEWAKKRNLINRDNVYAQKLKLYEEVGELASAILKKDILKQKDSIGDIYVVLIILAEQLEIDIHWDNFKIMKNSNIYIANTNNFALDCIENITHSIPLNIKIFDLFKLSLALGHDFNECIDIAYNQIKNRKGETINGTFIKNEETELERLYNWLNDENREPPQTKFPAGILRNVASKIHQLLKK